MAAIEPQELTDTETTSPPAGVGGAGPNGAGGGRGGRGLTLVRSNGHPDGNGAGGDTRPRPIQNAPRPALVGGREAAPAGPDESVEARGWRGWWRTAQVVRVKRFSPMKLMDENKTVSGTNMGHLFDRVDLLKPQFEALLAMYVAGQIRPRVDKTFRFDDAPAAHHYLHDRKAIGKVLLVP